MMDTPPKTPPRTPQHELRKTLKFGDGVNLVIGSIIGSGIFASPGVVFRHTKSGGASLFVWCMSGLIAYCGAISYVELALALPSAGGEVTYLTRFFRHPIVGFLFTWANATVARPAAFAITCIVCGQYLCRFLYGDLGICADETSKQVGYISFGIAFAVLLVNVISSKLTTWTLQLSTATSVFALLVAVVIGVSHALEMKQLVDRIGFADSSHDVLDWSPAFLAALWAYDGWNTLNYASEELASVKDFLSIIRVSISVVTFLFVFVNASYLIVLPDDVVASSETIGVDLAKTMFGHYGEKVMPLVVATSAFGSAVGNMFSGGRLVFSSARDGNLPNFLAELNERNSLPVRAVFCQSALGCLFLLVGNFEELVGMFSCATWVFYFATVLGLVRARWTEPALVRPYKVPIYAPFVFMFAALFLIIVEFLSKPKSSLLAFAFILSGIPFYYLRRYRLCRRLCCFSSAEEEEDSGEHVRNGNGHRHNGLMDEEEEEREHITYKTFSG
jgi:amino acid transporter